MTQSFNPYYSNIKLGRKGIRRRYDSGDALAPTVIDNHEDSVYI
jgi:hypothetical protein